MIKLCVECSEELGSEESCEKLFHNVFMGINTKDEYICEDCYETHVNYTPKLSKCVRCEEVVLSDDISIINDLPYCDYCKSKLDED